MALISDKKIAGAIYSFLEDNKNLSQNILLEKVSSFLNRRNLLFRTKSIFKELEKETLRKDKKIIVKIYSAKKIEVPDFNQIKKYLTQKYSNQELIFQEVFDSRLLGGIKIEIEDEVIDFTYKNRIKKLEEHLNK